MMFDLDKAVRSWRKNMASNESLEDGTLAELESHLLDEIDRLSEAGKSLREAFGQAVQTIGFPDHIGAECYKTSTRRWSGRPPWKPSRWIPSLASNYFKTTVRKLKRHKGYSAINIAGLAIGMAICLLILLWVRDELSYDRFHANSRHIFRITSENHTGGRIDASAGSPAPIGPTLKEIFPEIRRYTRVQSGWTGWFLHYGDINFMEERLAAVDPSFFEVFPFPFIKGDPKTALLERHSIVLTKTLAAKCFGDEEPLGKTMQISDSDMTVTGVIEDPPHNSHLQFDYAFPAVNMTDWRSSRLDSWKYDQFATYILVHENTRISELGKKILDIVKNYDSEANLKLFLQPLKDIHLHSAGMNSWMVVYPNPGNIDYVRIFSVIAACILLLACINFMNLSTARAGTRVREVGMRKVSGADRSDLIQQFFGESLVLAFLSLILAVLLAEFLLPAFNLLSGKSLSLDLTAGPEIILGLLAVALVTGIVSGSYPALFLSSFQPVKVLRPSVRYDTGRGGALRKVLVVSQFTFTVVLIIGTVVIHSQLRFIQNKDLGYDKDNIMTFASYGQYDENYPASRGELLQNPNILNVCRAFPPGPGHDGNTEVTWEGKDPAVEVMFFNEAVDYDYLDTFGMSMAEGRFFSPKFPTDTENYIINETAVKAMGLDNPLGKKLTYREASGTIIGVIKDYHGGSLHRKIEPKVITYSPGGFFVCVKYRGAENKVIGFLKEKWDKFVPGCPFQYRFLDESIAAQYETEHHIGRIFQYFSGLAVLIACLGLFGLASFSAERRTKEIGIRKILGASASGIIFSFSKEFAKWVLLANLIAWPAAYWIMFAWLQRFAYRIDLDIKIFMLSAAASLAIAVITVSYQSLRTALANPVDSLRYE